MNSGEDASGSVHVWRDTEANLTIPAGSEGLRRSSRTIKPTGKVLDDVTNRLHSLVGKNRRRECQLGTEVDENRIVGG
jgi:hypothetical protein